eukprot:TRINITY_DN8902_c0_g1_i1.p1 TRINITY_DN8902_c0_g1~~TRINITY_DN8902_c0_g1_i1.p1  ORF type:complete len:2139 (+),score=566.39 TRINITY_DN8902_c0_g1_i1:44-6460(+)
MRSARSGSVGRGESPPSTPSTSPAKKVGDVKPIDVSTEYTDAQAIHKFTARLQCTVAVGPLVWTAERDCIRIRSGCSGELTSPVPVFTKRNIVIHSLLLVSDLYIWAGLDDGYIVVIELETEKCMSDFRQHNGAVLCLTQDEQKGRGNYVFSGGSDWKIYQWCSEPDPDGRVMLMRMFYSHGNSVRCLGVTNSGYLASASSDNTVRLWDLFNGDQSADQSESHARLEGHKGAVRSLAIQQVTPERCLIWSSDESGCICLWGLEEILRQRELTQATVKARPLKALTQHRGAIPSLLLQGNQVWSSGQDGHVLCWGVEWLGGAHPPDIWIARCLSQHKGRLTGIQPVGSYKVLKVWTAALDYNSKTDGSVMSWNIELFDESKDIDEPDHLGGHIELEKQLRRLSHAENNPETDSLKSEIQQLRSELSNQQNKKPAEDDLLQENERLKRDISDLRSQLSSSSPTTTASSSLAVLKDENDRLRQKVAELEKTTVMMPEVIKRLEGLRKENEWLQKNAKELVEQKSRTCELLRLDVARITSDMEMKEEESHNNQLALENEIRKLQDDLRQWDRESRHSTRSVDRDRRAEVHLENEIRLLQNEKLQMQQTIDNLSHTSHRDSPPQQHHLSNSERNRYEQDISLLEHQVSRMQQTIDSLSGQGDDRARLENDLRILEDENQKMKRSGRNANTDDLLLTITEKNQEIEQLRLRLSRIENNHTSPHRHAEDTALRDVITDQQRSASELQETILNQTVSLENVRADYKNVSMLLENSSLEAESQKKVAEGLKEILNEKQKSIEMLREVVQERTQQIEALEDELRAVRQHAMGDYDDDEDRVSRLRDELYSKRQQIERLQSEVDELYSEKDRVDQKIAAANSTEMRNLQLESENEELKHRLKQADIDVNKGMEALEECSSLRRKILDMEVDMEKLVQALDNNPTALDLKDQLATAKEENAVLLSDNQTLANQQELLQQHVEELEEVACRAKGNEANQGEYQELLMKYQQVKLELDAEVRRNSELSQAATGTTDEVEELMAQVRELNSTLTAREEAAKLAQSNTDATTHVIQELREKLLNSEQLVKEIKSQVSILRPQTEGGTPESDIVEKLMATGRTQAGTIATLQLQNSAYIRDNDVKDEKLRYQGSQISDLQSRLSTLESQLSGGDKQYVEQLVQLHRQKNEIVQSLRDTLVSRENIVSTVQGLIQSERATKHPKPPLSPRNSERELVVHQPTIKDVQETGMLDDMMAEIVYSRDERRALRSRNRELLKQGVINTPSTQQSLVNDLTQELENCEQLLSQRETLVDTLQLKIATQPQGSTDQDIISQLEADVDDLQVSRSSAQATVQLKTREIAALNDRCLQLQSQLTSKATTIELLQQLLEEKAEAIEMFKKEFEITEDKQSDDNAQTNETIVALLERHDDRLSELQGHCASELRSCELAAKEFLEQFREKELMILDLQKTRQLNAQEIADVKSELIRATRELDTERNKKKELEKDMVRFTGTVTAAHKNIDELRQQLDDREAELQIAYDTTQRIEDLASQAGVEDIGSIKKELLDKTNKLRQLSKQIEASTESTNSLSQQVDTLREENSALKTECKDLQDALKEQSLDMEDLHQSKSDLQGRNEALAEKLSSVQREVADREDTLREAETKAELFASLKNEHENTSGLAKQALQEKLGAISVLSETVEELQDRLEERDEVSKQKDIQSSRQQESIHELLGMHETLKADLRRREQLLREANDKIDLSVEKCEVLESHKTKLEEELARQLQNNRSLEESNSDLKAKLSELKQRASDPEHGNELSVVRKLSDALHTEQETADMLRSERDDMEVQLAEAQNRIKLLEKQLDTSQKSLEASQLARERSSSVTSDSPARAQHLKDRITDLENTKNSILKQSDELGRHNKELQRLHDDALDVENEAKSILRRAVKKHHAYVTSSPTLIDMAKALLNATAAEGQVVDLVDPVRKLCDSLGLEQHREVDYSSSEGVRCAIEGCNDLVLGILNDLSGAKSRIEKLQLNLLKEKEKRKLQIDDVQSAKQQLEVMIKGLYEIHKISNSNLPDCADRVGALGEAIPKAADTCFHISDVISKSQRDIEYFLNSLLPSGSTFGPSPPVSEGSPTAATTTKKKLKKRKSSAASSRRVSQIPRD